MVYRLRPVYDPAMLGWDWATDDAQTLERFCGGWWRWSAPAGFAGVQRPRFVWTPTAPGFEHFETQPTPVWVEFALVAAGRPIVVVGRKATEERLLLDPANWRIPT